MMMMQLFQVSATTALFFSSILFPGNCVSARMMESERLLQYGKRGYEWPIKAFNPNTDGWNTLMSERLSQVSEIDDEAERYRGYMTTLFPALVISNLTEYGWAMTRVSDDLLTLLQQGIRDGFDRKQEEGRTPIIEGNQAWWIERDDLMDLVEDELHGPLEEWSGTDLVSDNIIRSIVASLDVHQPPWILNPCEPPSPDFDQGVWASSLPQRIVLSHAH